MSSGFQHDTNRRGGKTKIAHNRHARHAKQLRAMGRRRNRRQGRAATRARTQAWAS